MKPIMLKIFWTTDAYQSYRTRPEDKEILEQIVERIYSEQAAVRIKQILTGGRTCSHVLRVALFDGTEQKSRPKTHAE